MEQQNYSNHKRLDPLYHFVFLLLLLGLWVCVVINLVRALDQQVNPLNAIILLLMVLIFTVFTGIIRPYPLNVQNRAIVTEEGLRHFILTGTRLDIRLTRPQIIALRFASDEEFPELCIRAVNEKLSNKDIKKAIVSWRADHFRV